MSVVDREKLFLAFSLSLSLVSLPPLGLTVDLAQGLKEPVAVDAHDGHIEIQKERERERERVSL